MAGYPPYTVKFKGNGVPPLPNGADRQTPGPHTFDMTTSGTAMTVQLEHNNEKNDTEPTLVITFTKKP